MRRFAFVLLLGALTPLTAHADATVSAIKGGVLVSRGKGFERTTTSTDLKPGDRLMVTEGNSAWVAYTDGCSVELRPGAVHIVGVRSPCLAGQAAATGAACQNGEGSGRAGNCSDMTRALPSEMKGAARVVGVVGTVTIAPEPDGEERDPPPAQP